nr:basic-leucine zipper transcription factor A-like [Coffea arabica]
MMKSVDGLPSFLPPLTLTPASTLSSSKPSCITPSSSTTVLPFNFRNNFPLKSHSPQFNLRKNFLLLVRASDDNKSNNGEDSSNPLSKEGLKDDNNTDSNGIDGDNGGENGENGNGNGRGPRLNLKWVDLLLNPDPDNVAAVGLTGVLAWASVQVLWQLFVISIAILLAALKYSFIAALLIFILITLL